MGDCITVVHTDCLEVKAALEGSQTKAYKLSTQKVMPARADKVTSDGSDGSSTNCETERYRNVDCDYHKEELDEEARQAARILVSMANASEGWEN
ncbi:hypothetical protein LTR91_023415 [Friedmanniomyces endolithicus]|uniref:Uncharacterized protein n=1 Tax=Friedmanniomyces endolithicus TaxID=329885 RepID=A0AAN6JYG2_9PEZI|nr:hypothetical protein LTR57_023168 [Friedmanniomyces endolithicus]KAK0954235.1 hypothetical protein LTR91_023415 [Friedmanniomyces endolithicus]